MSTSRYVVFSHGKESGPWGHKISVLADTARAEGWQPESVDYRGIDDPGKRVAKLMDFCKELSGDLLLVGSSLGGYVASAAASHLHARGVFLMAPAIYFDGLPPLRPKPLDCPAVVVHGWRDAVIPWEHSTRLAQACGASLHLLDGDHGLHSQMTMIRYLFEHFVISLDMPDQGA